jgi:hypothetical protein
MYSLRLQYSKRINTSLVLRLRGGMLNVSNKVRTLLSPRKRWMKPEIHDRNICISKLASNQLGGSDKMITESSPKNVEDNENTAGLVSSNVIEGKLSSCYIFTLFYLLTC